MKALTVWQPWAGLIAAGVKPVENRGWRTSMNPGDIAIHAGRAIDWDVYAVPGPHPAVRDAVDAVRETAHAKALGAVVAVVRLAGCHRADGCCRPWGAPGGWHWEITDVRALPEPVPCKGARGLWTLPGDVEADVLARIGATR